MAVKCQDAASKTAQLVDYSTANPSGADNPHRHFPQFPASARQTEILRSAPLEDLRHMEAQGVEILTCGTCLNFYGLSDKLAVGKVTNMYTIVEKPNAAAKIIQP